MSIAAARRLRDQLTAHLDAAHSCPSAQVETIQGDLALRGDEPPAVGHGFLPEGAGEAVRGNAE